MRQVDSFYIKRDGKYIWLAAGKPLTTGDELIETRPMLIADEGKTLYRNGEVIGGAIWLKDTTIDDYTEAGEPIEIEDVQEQIEELNKDIHL